MNAFKEIFIMNTGDDATFDILFEKALLGYNNAYVPYSNFKVGASMLLDDGKIYYGCNVENSSYGLCNCAERTTLFKAYSEGIRKENIKAFLVIGNTNRPISPCGACRQVMTELLTLDTPVYLTNLEKKTYKVTVKDLLPYNFNGEDL